MRLVDELLVTALDKREAVPLESFCLRRSRRERPTITAVAGRGELAVGMVRICAGRVAVGDGGDLVAIAVAVGLIANADEPPSRVVGVRHLRAEASKSTSIHATPNSSTGYPLHQLQNIIQRQ